MDSSERIMRHIPGTVVGRIDFEELASSLKLRKQFPTLISTFDTRVLKHFTQIAQDNGQQKL